MRVNDKTCSREEILVHLPFVAINTAIWAMIPWSLKYESAARNGILPRSDFLSATHSLLSLLYSFTIATSEINLRVTETREETVQLKKLSSYLLIPSTHSFLLDAHSDHPKITAFRHYFKRQANKALLNIFILNYVVLYPCK